MNTQSIRSALKEIEDKNADGELSTVTWLIALARALCTELDEARKRKPIKLPPERRGVTHKFQIGNQFKAYMNVGMYDNGKPGEMFLTVAHAKLEEHTLANTMHGLLDVISVLTSTALQRGIPLEALVDKFAFTRFEPAGFTNSKTVPIAHSIVDYVFRWMEARFAKEEPNDAQRANPPG